MFKSQIDKATQIRNMAVYVKSTHDKSYPSQLLDILKLYRVNPSCNIWDYYRHRLYCCDRYSRRYEDTLGFATSEALSRSLNPRSGVTPSWNKLLFAVLCETYGIPTAKLLGVFLPGSPAPDFVPWKLHSTEDVKKFMTACQTPFYMKPVQCKQGLGGVCVKEYDAERSVVTTAKDETLSFNELMLKTLDQKGNPYYHRKLGYLFQEVIQQHPKITEFTGNAAPSGFRIVVLNDDVEPIIHRAIWKVVAPGNVNDNFTEGNNLLVNVDPDNGCLSEAVDDYWPYTNYHSVHPVTKNSFKDFRIPDWNLVVETLKFASSAIRTMNILHWDVFVTKDGPIVLELNDLGGTKFLQLHETALMDSTLRDFVKKNGYLGNNKKLRNLIHKKPRLEYSEK